MKFGILSQLYSPVQTKLEQKCAPVENLLQAPPRAVVARLGAGHRRLTLAVANLDACLNAHIINTLAIMLGSSLFAATNL